MTTKDIQLRCHCGRLFEVPLEMAGMEAKCPGCDRMIHVPIVGVEGKDIPALKGTGDEREFIGEEEFQEEETIFDKPISEVQKLAAMEQPTDQVEIAPTEQERYCPRCHAIIRKDAQACAECQTFYCRRCQGEIKIGHAHCPHCKAPFFRRPTQNKNWTRKERPFVCPHCNALPAEKVDLCYACGKPMKKEKAVWPAAPSAQAVGLKMGTARAMQRMGREGLSQAVAGWVLGFMSLTLAVLFLSPRSELGGLAWQVMTWCLALILAGRGFWVGYRAYKDEGQERWSAIAAMSVAGLVFVPLLFPYYIFQSVAASNEEANLILCAENVGRLAQALKEYRKANGGDLPPLKSDEFLSKLGTFLDSTDRLRCPARPNANQGYVCFEDEKPLPRGVLTRSGSDFPVLWDRDRNHKTEDSRRIVLFLSGDVRQVPESEFRELLRNARDTVRDARALEEGGGE
ncbi:MAG: hypothetical protein HY720_05455 [Planctomycetes bacterium]|nr:hypothetical protein [Planctomycetota bacterium]